MRMERGHLRTAWGLGGSLDADYLEGQHMGPTGGVTCPQQVGGSFLVQKWEGPASLPPRLEEQDEQGEIMPEPEESSLLPQGLQGTGRGQVGETVGGGHWVGDESGRFNLYTLDWTPQSAQMPPSQIHLPPESNQMPQSQTNLPLETNQMPLSHTYLPPETRKLLLSQTILPHKKDQLPLYSGSPFQSEQLPLSETTLPHDSDQLPQLTVVSPLETGQMPQFITSLPPEIGRMPQFAWSLALQRDLMPISPANLPPETQQLPLSGNCLTHNGEQLPLSEICLPHDTDRLPLFPLDSFVDSYQLPQSNNTLPHETEQLPIFTWDWALSTDPMPLPVTDLPPEAGKLPLCDAEDPFSIFRLDTPLESEQLSPETAGLSLSADLLSLSDLFSCMEADQLPPSQKDRDPLCDVTGQLPLSQVDTVLETEQLPLINVTAPLPLSQSHVPLETDQSPILGTPGQLPCTQADLPHESRQLRLPSVSDQLPLIHSDQLAFSCLVREPGRGPLRNGTDHPPLYHVDTLLEAGQLPQSCKRSPYKTDYLPPPDAADQIPQSELDSPLKRNRLPPRDVTDQQALCISDSYYEPHLLAQSLSASPIETCQLPLSDSVSLTESNQLPHDESDTPREINQLPLIVVTDSFDLLDQSSENTPLPSSNAKKQLPRSRADLLLETSQLPLAQVDTPLQTALFPPGDTTGQFSQSDPLHDSTQLPSRDVTGQMSQMDSPFENTHLPPFSAPSQLPLSQTGSPLEPTQLPRSDVTTPHQPADPPLPAVPCAPPRYGEGDLDSGLPLDAGPSGFGDELSRLRAVFDALDRDKDGFVKMEDFVQFATVYGAEQVKELTGYLDPAGLGVINFRDFYRGISEIQNEDLDMQLYDMGYPTEEEPPACSVDFDDFAAYEVTDSAYVGSESAYSECETFTDEDTGALAATEETEGESPRLQPPGSPEGLELSLCDISAVTVTGQEEQFEDFGEGAEPGLFTSSHSDEEHSFTQPIGSSERLSPSGAPSSKRHLLAPPPHPTPGGVYCSQCHKHVNRLEDLSTRLQYLEMDSPDKRTSTRKEARRLHHSSLLGEESVEPHPPDMACDDTDLTDKVLYLEQRVTELERDASTTGEQQNRLRQENLQLLHRVHALEEQLKDQELQSDEVQSEETRKHRDELRKMDRDSGYRLSSLQARVEELVKENTELRAQLPNMKALTQRLEAEKEKLQNQVEDLQHQLSENHDLNQKLGGRLNQEKHKQRMEKEHSQEVIEELRRELEQMQLLRLEMEHRLGRGNSAALQEYHSRAREAELEHEVRRLKQENRSLKEQNEELNGHIINLSIQGAKNLFSTTFSDSLAAEISSVSRDELMEAIQKQEEINLRLQDYIDRIIVAIMETNPAILEVKIL